MPFSAWNEFREYVFATALAIAALLVALLPPLFSVSPTACAFALMPIALDALEGLLVYTRSDCIPQWVSRAKVKPVHAATIVAMLISFVGTVLTMTLLVVGGVGAEWTVVCYLLCSLGPLANGFINVVLTSACWQRIYTMPGSDEYGRVDYITPMLDRMR